MNLKEKGILPKEKKSLEWIKEKKELWRKHRDYSEISPTESDTSKSLSYGLNIPESVKEIEKKMLKLVRM